MIIKKNNNLIVKILWLGVIFIFITSFISLVSALTPQEEISQLESELSSAGYGWLADYSGSDLYSKIEVYAENSSEKITTIENISSEKTYRTLLTALPDNVSYFTFDLKSSGGDIEYDYIVDPSYPTNVTALIVTGTLTPDATGYYVGSGSTWIRQNDSVFIIQYTGLMVWGLSGGGANWIGGDNSANPTSDVYTPSLGATGTATVSWANVSNYTISECGNITQNGTYTLSNSITATGTCFNITASNVTLDGNGFSITGSSLSVGYGVYTRNVNNITIKNFRNISLFNYGIYFISTNNSLILNNSVSNNNQTGIDLVSVSNNNSLINNIVNNNNQTGIDFSQSSSNNLTGNIVSYNRGGGYTFQFSSSYNYLIRNNGSYNNLSAISFAASCPYNYVIGNTLNYNAIAASGDGSDGSGIAINPTSDSIIVVGNTIYNNSNGMEVTSHNIIRNNNISNNVWQGVVFHASKTNVTIENNTINSNLRNGIAFSTTITNSNISGNNIVNNGLSDPIGNAGISIAAGSSGNWFLNNNIYNTTGSAIVDLSISSTINYLIYNNSNGEIKWTSGTFLDNLTVMGDLVLGSTMNITNGSIGISPTLLSANSGLNSTVNITFRNHGYIGQYPSLIHKMKRGSSRCADCYNFSALTASTLVINTSNFGDGTISLGKAVVSQSNVSLNTGWNLISLEMQNNDSGTQKNVTIVAGWNLIGYSSSINLSHSSVRFYNDTPGAVMTMTQASSRGYVQKYFGYLSNSDSIKKYQYVPKDVGNLTSQRGYWVYANTGVTGNITMPGVGGSPKNETYRLSDLMFRNSSGVEKNVTDALSAGWVFANNSDVNQMVFYNQNSLGSSSFRSVRIDDEANCADMEEFGTGTCNTNPWQGYMIYGLKSNITLLRQN